MRLFSRIRVAATALYLLTTVLFFAFFAYMGLSENVSVFSGRHAHDYHAITDYTVLQEEDPSAPVGVRTVYTWTLHDVDNSESCLCFYLVHQYADVYIDGELIHRLTADEDNRIGASISSNWVTVPIHQEDNGKEICIVLTPLFDSMADFEPEFLIGSHFTIIFDQLWQDIPQLFISVLCVVLGLLIIFVQGYFILRTHLQSYNMIYLGTFACLLGLWRLTDLKSAPILFSANPMVLGYISIGCLFLCGITLLLYASTLYSEKKAVPLLVLAIIGAAVSLVVLLIQTLGPADFKQMLPVSHIMLVVTICSVPLMAAINHKNNQSAHVSSNWIYFLIITLGIILDLLQFYLFNSSSYVIFTAAAFLVYTMLVFISNILNMTRKAYVDIPTGLINRVRWDELMHDHNTQDEQIGMIMMDLNGLKLVNDTFGHSAGDRMIRSFSTILQDTFPSSSQICHWGGDEFTIMMTGTAVNKLENYVEDLLREVNAHNAKSDEPPISYALGSACSTEFPQLSRMELLNKADERMYRNKKHRRA